MVGNVSAVKAWEILLWLIPDVRLCVHKIINLSLAHLILSLKYHRPHNTKWLNRYKGSLPVERCCKSLQESLQPKQAFTSQRTLCTSGLWIRSPQAFQPGPFLFLPGHHSGCPRIATSLTKRSGTDLPFFASDTCLTGLLLWQLPNHLFLESPLAHPSVPSQPYNLH